MEEGVAALEEEIREGEKALAPHCKNRASCQKALSRIQDLGHGVFRTNKMIKKEKLAVLALSRRLNKKLSQSPY